jgi:hypothetical protein
MNILVGIAEALKTFDGLATSCGSLVCPPELELEQGCDDDDEATGTGRGHSISTSSL